MRDKIFVFGASGHAKVVIDCLEKQGRYDIAFLVDDNPALKNCYFYGYPVIGGKDELLARPERPSCCIVAVGSNRARCSIASWLMMQGFELAAVVHPSAQIGRGTAIGGGTVVLAGAVVNSDTLIGRNVIINTRASVDHDCKIGDGVHLAPGSTLCGTVAIGEKSFVCAGATILPNLIIGKDAVIGAGSTVIRDVSQGTTVAGVPARELKK